jgi:hypothetical protein
VVTCDSVTAARGCDIHGLIFYPEKVSGPPLCLWPLWEGKQLLVSQRNTAQAGKQALGMASCRHGQVQGLWTQILPFLGLCQLWLLEHSPELFCLCPLNSGSFSQRSCSGASPLLPQFMSAELADVVLFGWGLCRCN